MTDTRDIAGIRRVTTIKNVDWLPYDLDGPVQEHMYYASLSYDRETRRGSYLIKMEPGTETIAHTHRSREEFMILEGEAIESDGTVLKAGDWIVMEPGSHHNTRTETGCIAVGLDWDPPSAKK